MVSRDNSKRLLAIVGPTGVGKTGLAIEIARQFGGEIVSVDSRQVYKGMDIGTGKDVQLGVWEERNDQKVLVVEGVAIWGLDLVKPDELFSVADWLNRIEGMIKDIVRRGKQVILAGGTGLYFEALRGRIQALGVPVDYFGRQQLAELTVEDLYRRLESLDGERVQQMNVSDRKNRRRLVRAIEIAGGKSKGLTGGTSSLPPTSYPLQFMGLTMERDTLYARVDQRVEQMFALGFVEEVRRLMDIYPVDLPSMSGIGYREVVAYLHGEIDLAEAKSRMKFRTHGYIRRQYTWFRRQVVDWLEVDRPEWESEALAMAKRFFRDDMIQSP